MEDRKKKPPGTSSGSGESYIHTPRKSRVVIGTADINVMYEHTYWTIDDDAAWMCGLMQTAEWSMGETMIMCMCMRGERLIRLCLVHPKTKKTFSRFPVTSSLTAHTWSIKYR